MPTARVLGYWEEHCTECGQPFCFARCPRYERARDGKCRRFVRGIRPVRLGDGTRAAAVAFKPWGKLEMPWRGAAATPGRLRLLDVYDFMMVPLARFLRALLPWMPWHRNPISFARAFRTRFLRWAASGQVRPNRWRMTVHAEKPTVLLCTVNRGGADVFCHRLALAPGWNRADLVLPSVEPVPGDDVLFRIFPPSGGTGELIFTDCFLYRGEEVPVPAPAAPTGRSAPYVKCLVWDLDNTLWDGILSEDGPEGIRLRPEAVTTLKELDRRGILHSVASKNDAEAVQPVLKALGLEAFFLVPQLGWGPKSAAVDRIASALMLGTDSFAFIDDAVYEREEVRAAHPEVRIYSEKDLAGLCGRPEFSPPVSSESASRRLSYLAEARRTAEAASFDGDAEAFLRSCGLVLTLHRLTPGDPTEARCLELTARTNRLTLAGRRYTPEAFRELMASAEVYAVSAKDRYGDYGTVGCLALRPGKDAEVLELVLSCRVAKKRCEQSLLLAAAEHMKAAGSVSLSVTAVATGRNGFLFEALDSAPFAREPLTGGAVRYTLALDVPQGADTAGCFRHPAVFAPAECDK